jgi:flagellar M-ring protein FliF
MNSVWKSIVEIWKGLTSAQRVTLAATATLTLTLLASLVWWSQRPQLSLLFAGLDPSEASKISDELRDQKVQFEISNGGRSIYVPSNSVYDLRLKLASKGIPKSGGTGNAVGFEIFDKPSFGLSDFLQKANYYRALQGELSRTISQMEEVESARVMIVVPNEHLFATEKSEAKASVFLQLSQQGGRLGKQQVKAIRFLVANGIEGLKPSKVAIVDNSGNVLAEDDDESTSGMTGSQMEMRRSLESLYASKVQTMLDQVLGIGQSVVRATVEMNFDNVQQTEERFDPAGSVIRTESTTVEESENPTHSSGGVAGLYPNSPAGDTNSLAQSQVLVGKTKKSNVNNQYEITKVVQNTLKGAGDIKKISLAVFVNQKVEGTGTDRKSIPRTEEEKELLRNVVKSAVGFTQEGKNKRNDDIKLEEVPFAVVSNEFTPKSSPVPLAAEKYEKYIGWGGQAIVVGLAIGLLLYFRQLLKSSRSEQLKTDLSIDELMGNQQSSANRSASAITVAELSKLIRENPTNMAQSLKTWLSSN